jgi:hypothetical protein
MLRKIIKLLLKDDTDPCKKCLVLPCCTEYCKLKTTWKKHCHSFMLPFLLITQVFHILVITYFYVIAILLNFLGLVSIEKVNKLDPFKDVKKTEINVLEE